MGEGSGAAQALVKVRLLACAPGGDACRFIRRRVYRCILLPHQVNGLPWKVRAILRWYDETAYHLSLDMACTVLQNIHIGYIHNG